MAQSGRSPKAAKNTFRCIAISAASVALADEVIE
jgi:hypothetical protein